VKRVAWFAVARTPYNDFLFETLSRRVDLTVVYTFEEVATHPWEFAREGVATLNAKRDLARCAALARRADGVVLSGWHDPRYLLLTALLPRRTPKAFWTDTPRRSIVRTPSDAARWLLMRWVFRQFDQVWSTGKVGCRELVGLGCPPEKVRSLPFFYDLTRYERVTDARRSEAAYFRDQYAPRDGFVFLAAGQLAKKKRFDDAIRALARLESKAAVLWLCGSGPEGDALRRLAHECGVADRVQFHGWLQANQLELAFLAADVFVHPASLDPFPTVVLDAMTWGKPVIGTDVSGSVVDRVVHGENGFIFREGDVGALGGHMEFFVRNREALTRFQLCARRTACQYPVDLAVDRLVELMGPL
jgi:glycosyltransferase involved in cell wall biosynthesis